MKYIWYLVFFVLFIGCKDSVQSGNENQENGNEETEEEVEPVEPKSDAFFHPGILITEESLNRMRSKVSGSQSPWIDNYNQLINNEDRLGTLDYESRPQEYLCRGGACGSGDLSEYSQNYILYSRDIQAAFELALIYLIESDTEYADKAIEILNGWADTLELMTGDSNVSLLAGNFGYQFALVGEMLRDYEGWSASEQEQFKTMLTEVVYPLNHDFLERHHDTCDSHYRSNWDAVNMASIIAIGVYTEDLEKFNYIVDYYQNGPGNGNVHNLVHTLHENPEPESGPDELGQTEEAGRDQPHNMAAIGWMGIVTEIAWNQGVDLYGYDDNRFLKGIEYVARYNLTRYVPYESYHRCSHDTPEATISEDGRNGKRAIWEPIFNHYVKRKGLNAKYLELQAQQNRLELPSYVTTGSICCSWAFETMGYGTLMYYLE